MRWLRSLFAWREARAAGVWLYQENEVTGARRAVRRCRGGWSPVNLDWLDEGYGHPTIDGFPAWRSAQGQAEGRYCF